MMKWTRLKVMNNIYVVFDCTFKLNGFAKFNHIDIADRIQKYSPTGSDLLSFISNEMEFERFDLDGLCIAKVKQIMRPKRHDMKSNEIEAELERINNSVLMWFRFVMENYIITADSNVSFWTWTDNLKVNEN